MQTNLNNLISAIKGLRPKLIIDIAENGYVIKSRYDYAKIKSENPNILDWFKNLEANQIQVFHFKANGTGQIPLNIVTDIDLTKLRSETTPGLNGSSGLNGLGMVEMGKLQNYDSIKTDLEKEKIKNEALLDKLAKLKDKLSDNKIDLRMNEYESERKPLLSPELMETVVPLLAPFLSKLGGGKALTGAEQPSTSSNLSNYQKEMIKLVAVEKDDILIKLYQVHKGIKANVSGPEGAQSFIDNLELLIASYGLK